MQMRERPTTFFAGQITGVEGYVESVAMGWLAGVNAVRFAEGQTLVKAPEGTAIGALAHYVAGAKIKNFQPVNITFALLPPLAEQQRVQQRNRVLRKRERHQMQVELALKEWDRWLQEIQFGSQVSDLRFQISDFRSQISDRESQIADQESQISKLRSQISDHNFPIPKAGSG
jgi:septal ring factor EnvC (AmiA/AmiB activator)